MSVGERPKVLVPVANGSEEMEAVIIIDVLVRAGAEVHMASVEESKEVRHRALLLIPFVHSEMTSALSGSFVLLRGFT